MTNKEAIRILDLECDEWDISHCTASERRDAFEMAITALQELENARKDTKTHENARKHINNSNDGVENANLTQSNGIEAICDAPTVNPEPHWIPVSERLPEDKQLVLVTYKMTDRIHVCRYHEDGSRNQWYSFNDMCREHNNAVLAWTPLPEPYREEGEK